MNKEVIHLQVNNVICEGYGCFNKANTKINVKVGQLGTIPLDLCTFCVKKFDENTPRKNDSKQKIVTNEEGKYKEAIEK
jgi:Zn finger protein HypA/HybF involved in hydrogenase expression